MTDAPTAGYRALSYWHDSVAAAGDALERRPGLDGDADADVVIVGGGLTGLWTAWYLSEREPDARILVLEKEIAGFGASGRNGGWCSALFPRSTASLAKKHGRDAALAMRRAMIDTVDEVGRASVEAGIDCDYVRAGTVVYARSAVQERAARAEVADAAEWGVDELEWWGPERVAAVGAVGGVYDPACARLHPAKLVRGLAAAVEARGVRIAEGTTVTRVDPGRVETDRGVVTCDRVVIAVEGYGAALAQTHRRILPLYSLMIATEPLPAAFWDEVGIPHGRTFSDYRHLLVYGQRTADDRFAFGGRGARYHFGSAIKPDYDRVDRVFAHLRRTLGELFPAIGDAQVSHTWGGPLGVPRDWHAAVRFDPATRIGWAGGYVGDGLSTTNLAGRTLADLLTGADTELTRLPWAGHRSPDWEIEPLRFLGANAGLVAMTAADVEERVTRRGSFVARVMGPLVGH
ncbi:FAD-dependent oxidoreductase [Protaetiibacter sp. SSC-01]|uniref:NAD(P)/FAD-dependent oxidoreductase n=1 Tax=Protaetiibacter sp. SSC-01 TaxID=2759943 RepID=UPI0016569017|nr:FAD-binding oxidoreductase [Protaetiibacter sp. SSC-01]QNO38534.1 FAD-dependent oxidoreductase [Protaetiibacter sp. SSC-01]